MMTDLHRSGSIGRENAKQHRDRQRSPNWRRRNQNDPTIVLDWLSDRRRLLQSHAEEVSYAASAQVDSRLTVHNAFLLSFLVNSYRRISWIVWIIAEPIFRDIPTQIVAMVGQGWIVLWIRIHVDLWLIAVARIEETRCDG